MWPTLLYVLPLALSTLAIRVPVDGKNENATQSVTADKKQDMFYIPDGATIDSYLIPPDQHRPAEVLPDVIVTPATYLLPPSPEKQIDYYAPTEAGEQTDWYPIIAQVPLQSTPGNLLLPTRQPDVIPIFLSNNQTFEIVENPRGGKAYKGDHILIPIPSRQLQPPLEAALNDYVISKPSAEFELPSTEINQPFNVPTLNYPILVSKHHSKNPKKTTGRFKPADPTLALHLTPPKPESVKYKKPTKLYPKKVTKGFHPIPIPIAEFADETTSDVPRAKPLKPFKPASSDESEYYIPDEKKIYLNQQDEHKRKLKGGTEVKLEQPVTAAEDTYGVNAPAEQETSETNYRHPGRNAYPAPLRQAPPPPVALPQKNAPAPPAPGERTEFRMHGMKGPHSYQFGFDTGKGKNRQFRYEERDNDGHVKGHYGYVDKLGKLRVVNYDADPKTGFRAEEPKETE